MSRTAWGALLLISALSMRAVAGWVCDGVRESSGGGEVSGGTNWPVRVQDVGGTSVVYVVTDTGHTNMVGRFRSE